MKTFIKRRARKTYIDRRKLVHGVGVNDAWFTVQPRIDGKTQLYIIYDRWVGMIRRCYGANPSEKNKSYLGCSVCDEWLNFSQFDKWASENWIDGYQLDKDFLLSGNKIYSPDTCLFVSPEVNSLMRSSTPSNGFIGVDERENGKWRAKLSMNGTPHTIGTFDTREEAFSAYKENKYNHIINTARRLGVSEDPRLKPALISYAHRVLEFGE